MLTRDELSSTYYLSPKEKANNISLFVKLSSEEDPLGHCWLGACYYNGRGVEKDISEAMKLYRRASDQDYPLGHCWLGLCYEKSAKDISKAVILYKKAFKLKDEYFVHINRNLGNFSLEDLIEIKDMCISHARLDYRDIVVQSYIEKYLKSAAYMKLCKNLFMTKCLHLYHSGCVENQKKCPRCRSELEEINC